MTTLAIKKRIDKLKRATQPAKLRYMVIFQDLDDTNVYWTESPISNDKGKRIDEAEYKRLQESVENLVVVEYTHTWRE